MVWIYTHSRRQEVRHAVAQAVASLVGRGADSGTAARGVLLTIGTEALSIIKDAFLVKSAGGTDEAGDSWPPLKPETIAYSRLHPGLNSLRAKAKAEGRPGRPLLTGGENVRWKQLYARKLHNLAHAEGEMLLARPAGELKAQAAAYAWYIIKAEGGKTIIGEYGRTEVEILRDKGLLLNSLSPGEVVGTPNTAEQILEANPGEVIVGTNRKGAAAHHRGRRRLWPDPSRWPGSWIQRLLAIVSRGISEDVVERIRP